MGGDEGGSMIKPEDIVITAVKLNVGTAKHPTYRTAYRATFQTHEQFMMEPYLEDKPYAIAVVKEMLRRTIWDRIYEPVAYRRKVYETIEKARDEAFRWGGLTFDAQNALLSLVSHLNMPLVLHGDKPTTVRMDNGNTMSVRVGDSDTLRGGPNLADPSP
jgi:hypothetical protein